MAVSALTSHLCFVLSRHCGLHIIHILCPWPAQATPFILLHRHSMVKHWGCRSCGSLNLWASQYCGCCRKPFVYGLMQQSQVTIVKGPKLSGPNYWGAQPKAPQPTPVQPVRTSKTQVAIIATIGQAGNWEQSLDTMWQWQGGDYYRIQWCQRFGGGWGRAGRKLGGGWRRMGRNRGKHSRVLIFLGTFFSSIQKSIMKYHGKKILNIIFLKRQ